MKKIALVGATGLVGQELLKLLENSFIHHENLFLFASQRSKGKKLFFKKQPLFVNIFNKNSLDGIDLAFFCAGSKLSKQYIPQIAKNNIKCIDLSSAFRKDPHIPLVIPEINLHTIKDYHKIIASPNCTTTIMLMPLFPLHRLYKIKSIIVSTYQAASGGGYQMMNQLEQDTKTLLSNQTPTHKKCSYGFNLFLHESPYLSQSFYSEEEEKMVFETRKILENPNIMISATCVRVPVMRAHSLSLHATFEKTPDRQHVKQLISYIKGVQYIEDFEKKKFSTPQDATKQQRILCSRVRTTIFPNSIEMWVVGDQLLKGGALNAWQIAQHLLAKKS